MSVLNSPGRAQGEEMLADIGIGALEWRANKATAITMTIHDICNVDVATNPKSWRTCPLTAAQIGPWAVCSKTVLAAEGLGLVSLKTHGLFYVRFDAIVQPWTYVQNSTTTVGRVIGFTSVDLNDWQRKIGICLGSADSWDTGTPVPTAVGAFGAVWIPFGGF